MSMPFVSADTPWLAAARAYWKAGWGNPLPVGTPGGTYAKSPVPSGFTGAAGRPVRASDLDRWTADPRTPLNVALRLNHGLMGIDVDAYDGRNGATTLAEAQTELGPLPATFTSSSRGPGQPSRIHVFRIPLDVRLSGVERLVNERFGENIEILHHGHRYVMAAPSIHPLTGGTYCWYQPDGFPMDGCPEVRQIPDLPQGWLEFFTATPKPIISPDEFAPRNGPAFVSGAAPRIFTSEQARQFCETTALIPLQNTPSGHINTQLNDAAVVLGHFIPAFLTRESATRLLKDALTHTAYDGKTWNADATIRSGLSKTPDWLAERAPTPMVSSVGAGSSEVPDDESDEEESSDFDEVITQIRNLGMDIDRPEAADFFTDSGQGVAFQTDVLHGRYLWSKQIGWMRWTGTVWADVTAEHMAARGREWTVAGTAKAVAYAEKLLRDAARKATADPKDAKAVLKEAVDLGQALIKGWRTRQALAKLTALVGVASGLCEVPDAAIFDANPDILNTASGIVDLRTGELRPAEPEDMCRNVTFASYIPGFEHADWSKALEAVPAEYREWFQMFMGQAITGYPNRDDRTALLHGSGSNGKTAVLSEGIRVALGSYYAALSERVLMGESSAHPTEMMELKGVRVAVLEETQEAHYLDTQRLKKIVGTPTITARYMHRDSMTYPTTHTMLINTNHRPLVKESDHGTWRRLLCIPFPFSYRRPDEPGYRSGDLMPDTGLKTRLQTADVSSAVLGWLVAGAVAWYANGETMPATPEAIVAATGQWRQENDVVLGFLASGSIHVVPGSHVTTTDLLAAMNAYLTESGKKTWSAKLLTSRIEEHPALAGHVQLKRFRAGSAAAKNLSTLPSDTRNRFGNDSKPPAQGQYSAWDGLSFSPVNSITSTNDVDPFADDAPTIGASA